MLPTHYRTSPKARVSGAGAVRGVGSKVESGYYHSRKVVGWASSGIRDEQLVFVENALWMALIGRQPEAGLLHHSDRDSQCQYTARLYRGVLEHHGVELSMSRPGNCWDNALCESFFGSLKVECTYRPRATGNVTLIDLLGYW
jgi:transposase InsO family protein